MNYDNIVIYPGVGSATAIHVRWDTIHTWLSSFYTTHHLYLVGYKRRAILDGMQYEHRRHSKRKQSLLEANFEGRELKKDWLRSLTDEDKINLYFDVEIAHNITGEQYREMLEDVVQEVSKEIKDEEHPTTNTKI